jgi:Mn-dependent DtxR family transcriptional regulator
MDSEDAQATPHELFRLRRLGEERVLESLVRGVLGIEAPDARRLAEKFDARVSPADRSS